MRAISWIIVSLIYACAAPVFGQDARPNIILIVADDLGYADVGYHGQSKDIRTPNIDTLAAGGVSFINSYVSCPVCAPTRAGLLTGRYQQRFGFEQNPLSADEEQNFGLPLDQTMLSEALHADGYTTGAIGKWHLGNDAQFRPLQRGFDEFFGFLGGAHGYFNNDKPGDGPNAIRRGDEPVGEPEYLTDAFTREAVDFIERHHEQPFFLYLAYNAPHTPMQATEQDLAEFPDARPPKRRNLLAMVWSLDKGVGRVMQTLRDQGIDDNTIVIFMSDNGGPTMANASRNTPFSGVKGTTFEGGIRVPLALHWPARLPAGKVEDRTVIQLDLFPTILAAAGVEAPDDVALDGKDLLPFVLGENDTLVHDALYWRFGPRRGMRQDQWKLQWNDEDEPRLSNLDTDPAEQDDLSEQHADVKRKMLDAYARWDAELSTPRWRGRLEGPGNRQSQDEE